MMKEHWSKPLWEGTVVDKELQHFPTFTDWWSNSVRTDYMVRILRVIGGDTAYGQRIRLFACRCLSIGRSARAPSKKKQKQKQSKHHNTQWKQNFSRGIPYRHSPTV